MSYLAINGADMPRFQTLSIGYQDLDGKTTRDELGYMHRDRIRQGIRKVSVKWPPLTQSDAAIILNAISPAKFIVSCIDAVVGTVSISAYVGDRTVNAQWTPVGIRWDISCDFVEY